VDGRRETQRETKEEQRLRGEKRKGIEKRWQIIPVIVTCHRKMLDMRPSSKEEMREREGTKKEELREKRRRKTRAEKKET
jgi:hypothetical protein